MVIYMCSQRQRLEVNPFNPQQEKKNADLVHKVNWCIKCYCQTYGCVDKPRTPPTLQESISIHARLILMSALPGKIQQLGRKSSRSFVSLTNDIHNCSVTKVRTQCVLSAKGGCSTKWTLIWFFCRVRVRLLFSRWINNATMRILPFPEKGLHLFILRHSPS